MRTEEILNMLGGLLEELECRDGCDRERVLHNYEITEEFIRDYFEDNFEEAMDWIKSHGGCCCDCEVITNITGSEQGLLAQLWHLANKDSHKAVLIEKLFDLTEEAPL